MLDRLLVGYGAGPGSRDALALARMLASVTGGDLLIASHTDPDLQREACSMPPAERYVHTHEPRFLAGASRARALAEHAELEDADTIVLGTRSAGRPQGRGTAAWLMQHCPLALAIAPEGFAEWTIRWPSVVGVLAGSEDALTAAAPVAVRAARRLHVLWEGERDLDGVRERLPDLGLEHVWVTDQELPAHTEDLLLTCAAGLDLLVVARPAADDERVAELMAACPCPLLIAPPAKRGERDERDGARHDRARFTLAPPQHH
jgi:hypothetical protein